MDYNKLIKHVDFANNSTLSNTTHGSCFFSGNTYFESGYDYVGLQIGDDVDKWQITAIGSLRYRQNDSGGTNTSWGAWKTIVDSSNCGSYSPQGTGTLYTDERISCLNVGIIPLSGSSSYTIEPNTEYIININNYSNVNITLKTSSLSYPYSDDLNGGSYYQNEYIYRIILNKSSNSSNSSISFTNSIKWMNSLNISQKNAHYEINILYDPTTSRFYGLCLYWDLS